MRFGMDWTNVHKVGIRMDNGMQNVWYGKGIRMHDEDAQDN